jgi:hypothetical protein
MENPRNAADKVRPILQAMERSIDSARRRRLNTEDATPAPDEPRPQDAGQMPHIRPDEADEPEAATPPRLKARPKRPSSFLRSDNAPELQTRIG